MMFYWSKGVEDLRGFADGEIQCQRTLHWPLVFPEIIDRGGFDALVGNPPFRGGSRLSIDLGEDYRSLIVNCFTPNYIGRVDLCCYFLIAANMRLRGGGCLGYVATSSIAEGHNAECLDRWLLGHGNQFYWTCSKLDWPGTAKVSISLVVGMKAKYLGASILNGEAVQSISANLKSSHRFGRLTISSSVGLCFRGVELRGDGFILSSEQADGLLLQDKKNRNIIRPYLNGSELNRNPAAAPASYVFDFNQMSQEEASEYDEAFRIVTDTVKPLRDAIKGDLHEKDYWKFYDKRQSQFKSINAFSRILVKSRDSVAWAFCFVPPTFVIGSKVVIFKFQGWDAFGLLQSSIHRVWCEDGGSTIGKASTYNPTHGLETFVFPQLFSGFGDMGSAKHFHDLRHSIMSSNRWSLTEVHNRLESASDRNTEIVSLRRALSKLDADIAKMYGWNDVADKFNQILPTDKGGYSEHLSSSGLDVEVLKRLQKLNALESSRSPSDQLEEKAPLRQSRKMRDFTKSDNEQLRFEI